MTYWIIAAIYVAIAISLWAYCSYDWLTNGYTDSFWKLPSRNELLAYILWPVTVFQYFLFLIFG